MLRLSSHKGIMHFVIKGKLASRYIGPFQIVQCIGVFAYHLALLLEIFNVDDEFHVSILRKFQPDPNTVI